jgi:FkbM family methyltransferase
MQKNYSIDGIQFTAFDIETSKTLVAIENEFRENIMEIEKLIFSENPIIIDIGANVGIVSFYFAKKYPTAKIYAYEPHPINFKNLLNGIEINKFTNIYPFNLAVLSKSNEIVNIHLHENNTSASSIFRFYPTDPYEQVKTISLNDIIKNNNIPYIDFLKIDCEGAEFDIIENTDIFYNNTTPIYNIFIEFHKFMELKENKNINNVLNKLTQFNNCKLKNLKTIVY